MRSKTALLTLLLLALATACREEDPTEKAPAAGGKGSRWSAVEELVRKKDLPAAYSALEAMRVPGKDDPDLTLRLAEVRRLQGDQVKAILLLREGVAANPKAFQLVNPLATLYLQVGDNQKAREVLEAARAQGASSVELSMLLGQAYGRLEQFDLALREFDAAQALGKEAPVVLYNKALIYGQTGKHAEAIRAFEEVVAAEPAWPAAQREHARAILDSLPKERKEVERALDMLIGVKEKLAEDWRLHESIGDAWLLLGDYEAAILAYTDALRFGQNPKSVEDRYRVAVKKKRERDAATPPPPTPPAK